MHFGNDLDVFSLLIGAASPHYRRIDSNSRSSFRDRRRPTRALRLTFLIPSLGFLTGLVIAIIAGIVAFVGAGQIKNTALNIILLILGYLAWGIGGILIILGALVALVTRVVKT